MADNIFTPGAVKTAKFNFSDPSLVGLALTIELYMSKDAGVTKATTTGAQAFTCASTNPFSLAITMPTAAGDYKAYIAVSYLGTVIEGFVDTNDELITGGSITTITWS
jgi:hypothetical protein